MMLRDLRILHITNNLGYGGVQKIIYELCDATKEEVDSVYVASSGGVYVDRLREIGVKHFEIPDVSSTNPRDVLTIISKLSRIVRDRHINVIQCHHRMAVLFARFIHCNAKIIYINHTTYSDRGLLTHVILRNIPVIAVGQQARDNAVSFFNIPDRQVTIIPNAVKKSNGPFPPVKEIEEQKKQGKFIVTLVGRLHPQKGVQYFIEAAAKVLMKHGQDIAFFVVGDGPLRVPLEELSRNLGVRHDVHFVGFRKDSENFMYHSDVIVMSSVYEGLPLTPIEACSVGKAIVAPDIPGVSEVVVDGINGLLFEIKNSTSLANAIDRMYEDRGFLDKCGKNAKYIYQEKFAIEPFKQAYCQYYESL